MGMSKRLIEVIKKITFQNNAKAIEGNKRIIIQNNKNNNKIIIQG
jgi:hypothetical protein